MIPKMGVEQQLLQEVKGLTKRDIAKIVKIVRAIKEEMFEKNTVKGHRKEILQYAGILKDLTAEESKIFDKAVARRSLIAGRKIEI